MSSQLDVERVRLAEKVVRAELLAERTADGRWLGEISSSPVATATAVSALVLAHGNDCVAALKEEMPSEDDARIEELVQGDLTEMLVESLHWLARYQNPDGGWGDCTGAQSNLAATLLVQAAFRLTGIPAKYADLMVRADDYVDAQGGVAALKQCCGKDKTLLAAILTNCALAGMVPWRQVPALPFEAVSVPQNLLARLGWPVVRHSIPLLVAVGRAKFHHNRPLNPISRLLRSGTQAASLKILGQMQASDGSFRDTTPLTAFVVMSLASCGLQDHPIVQRGVEFLLSAIRSDTSWSIVNSLATWNTTLAINSLCGTHAAAETVVALDAQNSVQQSSDDELSEESLLNVGCLDWLLDCQRTQASGLFENSAGGWSWNSAAGAVPNVDDTTGVLLALAHFRKREPQLRRERVEQAATTGVRWLLEQQNQDGGWSVFYRSDQAHDYEQSGTDITAHAMRALTAWRAIWDAERLSPLPPRENTLREPQISAAVEHGWAYLESQQAADGSFVPLWFGNEHQPDRRNPVYGTSRVLVMCDELSRMDTELARRAVRWLLTAQHTNGGWGPPRAPLDYSGTYETNGNHTWRENDAMAKHCSVEETALAVMALLPQADENAACSKAVFSGLNWLVNAVEQDAHRNPAILGFYFKKLWYYERLYPLVFAAGALSRGARQLAPKRQPVVSVG